MTSILAIITVIAIVVAFIAYKLWSAKKEVERVLKVNASLEQKNQQQAVEIQTKNTEIHNAQIQRKYSQAVQRSNAASVDSQLHAHNWFREDDSHHRVSGVQSNLSKPSGYGRDEASDSGSQSDSSGGL
ncbi:DUF2681 domain-containing protein [Ursidibacter arcticus]